MTDETLTRIKASNALRAAYCLFGDDINWDKVQEIPNQTLGVIYDNAVAWGLSWDPPIPKAHWYTYAALGVFPEPCVKGMMHHGECGTKAYEW